MKLIEGGRPMPWSRGITSVFIFVDVTCKPRYHVSQRIQPLESVNEVLSTSTKWIGNIRTNSRL